MALAVGSEQSYCLPGGTIQNNLFLLQDLLTAADLFGLNFGSVSLGLEKAFDWVSHDYFFWNL